MAAWLIVAEKMAVKDARKLKAAGLQEKAQAILEVLAIDPFQNPPPFEKLIGDLAGMYSRRINVQHRLVYDVNKKERKVRILRMWSYYD